MERIISYDLAYADTDDYQEFYEVLKLLNGKKLTESTYVINTTLTQNKIIEKIKAAMNSADTIYYISVDSKTHELFYQRIVK